MMWNYGYDCGLMMGWGGWGLFSMIFGWIFIVAVVILFVKWITRDSAGKWRHNNKSAIDILEERYARGEIDKKEFEEKSQDIKDS